MNSNSNERARPTENLKGIEGSTMAIKVHIVFYTRTGHVERLARKIKEGADSVEGVESKLWQVPDTLRTDEVAARARRKSNVPAISRKELLEGDGFVFGFPTRFGMMAAPFQEFLDSIGSLWDHKEQLLEGKPAGIFFSTGCQGGGQETTELSTIPQLVNRGMLFVPIGHILGAGKCEVEEVNGGSPFGAGTYAGSDGLREPSEIELTQAFHQGKYIATITKKLKRVPQCSFHNIARRLSPIALKS